jgi:hypothetical protein
MPWNTIAITDVTDELSPQELAAFNTLQNQSTTQNNILARVVNEVRGSIRAGGNEMDAEGTIPDQLRNDVIDICLWRFIKKFPALKALASDARRDAYAAAKQKLTDLSRKDSQYRIELPNAATAESTPAPVNASAQISGVRRQLTRKETKGL